MNAKLQHIKNTVRILFLLLMVNVTTINARNLSETSIYDYLKTEGHYNVYTRLIEDLDFSVVLSSIDNKKTLFVANDSAFDQFFKNNEWKVTEYNQLTLAQKKYILNFSMFNNAISISTISDYISNGLLIKGSGIRKMNFLQVLDSIPYLSGNRLPTSKYWDSKRTTGSYVLCDNTNIPTVFFSQDFMNTYSITDDDLNVILGIDTHSFSDVYIFNNKVIKRDIGCNNGYIHVLQSVLIPPMNMAQYIKSNPNTQIFSRLLDRFCAPYYDVANTSLFHQLHPELIDSIFTKHYFSNVGGATRYPGYNGTAITGASINTEFLLPFDPGWNGYYFGYSSLEANMAAMFVPSDEAMIEYMQNGIFQNYGSWDNVPDKIIVEFISRCMRTSLTESVPSKFSKMLDMQYDRLPVDKGDIIGTYTGVNGVVYVTNKVYPPTAYTTAYAPVLLSSNTKVIDWLIKNYENGVYIYKMILSSKAANYSLFLPTDEYLTKYIDPIAFSKTIPGALKYWYNTKTSAVNATFYKYDKQTATIGDSIGIITDAAFIKNRLVDVLNSHIVVGDIQPGKNYYKTRGNNYIKVSGSGTGMTIEGGGNISMGTHSTVLNVYNQANGKTYLIDYPIQTPLKSVYQLIGENAAFSEFYKLLSGFPAGSEILKSLRGIDFNIKFFNTYNYTVYVPTNEAINKAFQDGIITPWTSQGTVVGINDMTDAALKTAAISKLDRFLRYHFQDNSVFVDNQSVNTIYQSATIKNNDGVTGFGTAKNKFYKIGVSGVGGSLKLTTEIGKTVHVITSNGLYNIMARDFIFSNKPSAFKEIDGSGTGSGFYSSTIVTSSTAVIHQIDNVLTFE
jgi:uncharacterized surface protein with fasciclin (FAS1) repeats